MLAFEGAGNLGTRNHSGALCYIGPVELVLRVPADNDRGPLFMDQALAALHQAHAHRLPLTLAMASCAGSVALTCRCPATARAAIEGQLLAHYPDLKLERAPDAGAEAAPGLPVWYADLHLARDLFPIKRYSQFEDPLNRTFADPVTGLLSALGANNDRSISARVEFHILPAASLKRRYYQGVLHRLATPFFRQHHRFAHWYLHSILSTSLPLQGVGRLLALFGRPLAAHSATDPLTTSAGRSHERESDLQAAADKLGKLLFDVRLRLQVEAPAAREAHAKAQLREMAGAFGQFSLPRLGSFHPSPIRQMGKRPYRPRSFLLSAEEMATLWHPPTQTVRVPSLGTVASREFAPPVKMPTTAKFPDMPILGRLSFRQQRERFGILPEDRRRHLAVLGKTGMGKSTLLHHLVSSDIAAGRGIGLIDPHGDLCEAVLRFIPRRRTNDVILFDAGDVSHPLSFNVLHCRRPQDRALTASAVLSAFKKMFGDSWGPRLEHILRNTLLALLEVPGTSLLSVLPLLSDSKYRQHIVQQLTDPVVRHFWLHEFASLPQKLQIEAVAPIQNKVGHFISSPLLRNILGQSRSALDLRQVMDEGRVLLVNLAKGRIGDDASGLLGSLLVTSLQTAAMSRAELPEENRRDFFLYVDEFQNFATDSFASILSEARKYRLNLTLANQYLAQIEEPTLHAVFGNVGTLVVFQVGANDAEILTEQLGGDLEMTDLLNLPSYRAYVRLLLDGQPSRPFSMQTLPPPAFPTNHQHPSVLRRTSRQRYARHAAQVQEEIRSAFTQR